MKERMLTVLVPIKDVDATEVAVLPALDVRNKNVIYKHEGVYKRMWLNPETNIYEYREVVDREFPYLGKPLEIFDFTYDATRMGNAPMITAQGVKWYADKDDDGNDVTLEDLWLARNDDCHVTFNGENFYLKQIPTCEKDNDDARYKYDIDFVSGRVVLEHVYIYDVVQPFVSEKPISESSSFSFFGNVEELARRINASMLRSGISYIQYKEGVTDDSFLTYAEFNSVGLGTYSGTKDTSDPYPIVLDPSGQSIIHPRHDNVYEHFGGDYNKYLMNLVYEVKDPKVRHIGPSDSGYDEIYGGDFDIKGYACIIGKDKKGDLTTSDEKLIVFENNTIHEALQCVHDDFGLQYYITLEKDEYGNFTGNTLIMIADCEHDFADVIGDDYARDKDGIPTTDNPFDYGVDNELLSKEKTNTTDKIVTRITGVGSEDNIPWYYPNPNADGWIKPIYKREEEEYGGASVDYPKDETQESVRYEKYLKNRIGDAFRYRMLKNILIQSSYDKRWVEIFNENGEDRVVYDSYVIDLRSVEQPRLTISLNTSSFSNCQRFTASLKKAPDEDVQGCTYDSAQTYTNPSAFQTVMINGNGHGYFSLEGGSLYYLYITFYVSDMPSSTRYDYSGYYYPQVEKTRPGYYTVFIADNFYSEPGLVPFVYYQGSGVKEAGYSRDEWDAPRAIPMFCEKGSQYKDVDTGIIYRGTGNNVEWRETIRLNSHYEENPKMDYTEWIETCLDLKISIYESDGWYRNGGNKKVNLSDYGISVISNGTPDFYDSIEFRRLKYITPQPTLMPQIYIRTDGDRRFYDAHNYDPVRGTADDVDAAVGEEYVNRATPSLIAQDGVINTLYSRDGYGFEHYNFENQYVKSRPHEHIENFDDVKPTIKGQINTVDGRSFRIDVVEEFGYDELDNDEVWEDNTDGNVQGEYKHPYFFAKLRPLGFNIFDSALQEDMVLSMTTGHCGACNFKIAVDENTKKNPVQLWPFDVCTGMDYSRRTVVYAAGSLKRYLIDDSQYYYDTDGTSTGYITVSEYNKVVPRIQGFLVPQLFTITPGRIPRNIYTADAVKNGEVGMLKQDNKTHFAGDVITSGKFIESQQDTSENFVWVALMKDTDSYGTIMPAARPDYGDGNLSVYIRPKSVSDVHTDISTDEEDEENADKFVLTNIRLPQKYLREAEKELSRRLVEYMYNNNYQKFNFSIRFSRIYLAQNTYTDNKLNENSVLYVSFNNRTYRQYVKHYTYRMTRDTVLPEILVDMNEELSVSRTLVQSERAQRDREVLRERLRTNELFSTMMSNAGKKYIGKSEDAIISGNLVSRDAATSFSELQGARMKSDSSLQETRIGMEINRYKFGDFVTVVNTFNSGVSDRLKQIRTTVERRLLPVAKDVQINDTCQDVSKYYFVPTIQVANREAMLWYNANGNEQTFDTTQMACPVSQGMTDISWSGFSL